MRYLVAPLVALLLAVPAFAQVDLGTSLYLAVSPQYPKPNEAVLFTIQNPIVDLSTRTITWKNSGTIVLQGEGETVFRTNAPDIGERMDITVAVEGLADTAALSIAPSSIDLMWESDSNTPGLYRGRHLPSLGSVITLQALPHLSQKGVEIASSQLTFTWTRDGQVVQTGKGKSSITIPLGQFTDVSTVSVNVATSDKTVGAERSATIAVVQPPVRLYIDHPLYGIMYHKALSARTVVSDTEMSFAAIPYFAQATNPNDPLFSYTWRVNKDAIESNKERPNTITINAGAAGGDARIEVALSHKKNYQLDAHGTWDVTFGSIMGEGGGDPFTGQ